MIVKVAVTLFALYAWSRMYSRFRKKGGSAKELIFWTFIWFGVIVIVFVPSKTNIIAHIVGMGRGFDALVFASMLAIFYALYKMTAKIKQQESEITKLVSELALSIRPSYAVAAQNEATLANKSGETDLSC